MSEGDDFMNEHEYVLRVLKCDVLSDSYFT